MKTGPRQVLPRKRASSYHIVRVLGILSSLKIIEYVQYLITCMGQRVLQGTHKTNVTYFFVVITFLAESFITFVISVLHDTSTCRTTQLTLTHGFFCPCSLLVVGETRATSKIPIAVFEGESNVGDGTRRAGHAFATCLVADVRDVICTCLVAPLHTNILAIAPVRLVIT